jgi:hypothetical protein
MSALATEAKLNSSSITAKWRFIPNPRERKCFFYKAGIVQRYAGFVTYKKACPASERVERRA